MNPQASGIVPCLNHETGKEARLFINQVLNSVRIGIYFSAYPDAMSRRQGAQRGVPRSGLWSGGKDCVERNGSERAKIASVAERKPPASPWRRDHSAEMRRIITPDW
jgi:hypothetical protein